MDYIWTAGVSVALALVGSACSSSQGASAHATGGVAGSGGVETSGSGGTAAGGAAGSGGDGLAGAGTTCASTNARVGWVATLTPVEAGVSGTATMVDDCTIQLEHFSYDGSGLEVYVYAGKGGNYNSGFALSDNIIGHSFTDETLPLSLPDGKTLDDVDGIAVWCADVGVSFGDGLFTAP